MKRKFKLFATVASLCLCLALMAFGVYAAASITYTASGSVKFELVDVFVSYESSMTATVSGATAEPVKHSGKTYTEANTVKTPKTDLTDKKEFGETVFKQTGDKVVLVVKITNDGSESIKVTFTPSANNDDTAGLKNKVVVYDNNGASAQTQSEGGFTLTAGQYVSCTLTVELANMENGVSSTDYSIVAKAEKAA